MSLFSPTWTLLAEAMYIDHKKFYKLINNDPSDTGTDITIEIINNKNSAPLTS
jgi:hypothetical protein